MTTKIPKYFYIGICLTMVAWILNWCLDGLRTHILFFPLWLGYCLTVDGLVYMRKGTSLLNRSPKKYISLFIISAPAWWLFELINMKTQNWIYLGKEEFSALEYALFASLNFSTVIPAVFGTAEYVATWKGIQKIKSMHPIQNSNKTYRLFLGIGFLMLFLIMKWPVYFYPFVWGSVYFILEPINAWLRNKSLLIPLSKGDYRPVFTLWTGCLICGFFWEMWNFYSFPKWIYQVPFVDWCHIFEMPILGFIGYLPFSLELFTIYMLLSNSKAGHPDYIQFKAKEIKPS